MDIAWYREKIMHVPKYGSSMKWQSRVAKMPPAQVIAIYNKFKKDGLFDSKRKKSQSDVSEEYYQMTIFDFLEEDDLK